jgi:hypothetical protein
MGLLLGAKLWKLIYGFHRILRIRHAERNLELERFYQLPFEIVSFDHQKFFDWFATYFEFKCSSNSSKMEKHRSKMILDISCRAESFFADLTFRFSYLK